MRKFKKSKFFLFKNSIIKIIIFSAILLIFLLTLILKTKPKEKFKNNLKSQSILDTYLLKQETYPNLNEENFRLEKNIDNREKEFVYKEKMHYLNPDKLYLSDEWFLEIPNILEKAEIKEGTENIIIDNYIGHFLNTAKIDGNVALAAHNRGFNKNYFENLRYINIQDKIIYTVGKKEYEYIVYKKYIVDETDLSCLNDLDKREITLITCVRNKPTKRLVVKGYIVE